MILESVEGQGKTIDSQVFHQSVKKMKKVANEMIIIKKK